MNVAIYRSEQEARANGWYDPEIPARHGFVAVPGYAEEEWRRAAQSIHASPRQRNWWRPPTYEEAHAPNGLECLYVTEHVSSDEAILFCLFMAEMSKTGDSPYFLTN